MDIVSVLIYLIIAGIVGVIAERIIGTGVYGLVGNVLIGLAGIWIMLNLLHWRFPGDLVIGGVPIITALLGAILVDVVLSLVLRNMRGGRRRWGRF